MVDEFDNISQLPAEDIEKLAKERITLVRTQRKSLGEFAKTLRHLIGRSDYAAVRSYLGMRKQDVAPPLRLTSKAFSEYAARLREYSQTPIQAIGNEYYSCCGLEDAEGERREAAGAEAIVLDAAAKLLKAEGR